MARPSKLTEKQWAEVERRHLAGESIRALAKEFGIAPSNVSARVSKRASVQKAVANQLATAELAFSALPVSEQIAVRNLADELKDISGHLASSAKYGAMTSHRLNAIAHKQTDLIDETGSLEENTEALKSVMAFTKVANEAASTGLNLLRANKETVDGLNRDADKPEPKQIVFTVADASD